MDAAEGAGHHVWYSLSWVAWVGVIGVVLTLVGLYLTYSQAKSGRETAFASGELARAAKEQAQAAKEQALKATTAAEASAAALRLAQQQIRGNRLLLDIAHLRWVESSLATAIEAGQRPTARIFLDLWRWSAGNIHGVLRSGNEVNDELLSDLSASMALSTTASTLLLQARGPMDKSCDQARSSISDVCARLNSWASEQSYSVHVSEETVDDNA